MSEDGWAEGLDPEQLAAVEQGPEPLVIVAGAGTGKTRTLTARVARLLDSGVAPERVLLLTFTRRAAASMTSRAAALCGDPAAGRRMWSGTFHAVAHRLVAEHAPQLGLADVSLLDPGDVVELLDLLREEHGLTGSGTRLPTTRALADVYSRAVNTGRATRAVMDAEFPWCLDHADAINALFRRLRRPQAGPRAARLRRSPALLAGAARRSRRRRAAAGPMGLGAGRRVPGRQPDPGRHRPAPAPRRPRTDRRR